MERALPLTTLLSQILVAFTIEFDNEAEHRLPHRTTIHGLSADRALPAPWLASMAMWFNCMQHVGADPVPLKELERRARTPTNLHGMQRWGYIYVTNDPGGGSVLRRGPKPPRATSMIRATAGGLAARQIWGPLFEVIEERWRERFGSIEIDALKDAARGIVGKLDPRLPDCMPILGYGFANRPPAKIFGSGSGQSAPGPTAVEELFLPSLLSKVLLATALEFESESPLSLAICADVVRVLSREGVRVRDLPELAGVSKEAIAMAFGILRKARLAIVEKEAGKRPWQIARLTEAGIAVQESYPTRLAAIEKSWKIRFGDAPICALRQAAETIAQDADNPNSLLKQSIKPYPDGWRAAVAMPVTLPHFPMVLHRGGYPDGS